MAITELFGVSALRPDVDWLNLLKERHCPYLRRDCVKTRKSDPSVAIGSCSASVGKSGPTIICPHRFLERGLIFTDALLLLKEHVAGNEIHRIREVKIPGGMVDYLLVSARSRKVADFVGIELQSVDTTNSIWPERQEFLRSHGISLLDEPSTNKPGLNWKMTAKTILVQLHHKVATFQNLNKKLVLVLQSSLLDYMRANFDFSRLVSPPDPAHPLLLNAYDFGATDEEFRISLASQASTDVAGIEQCLNLKADPHVELDAMQELIESKLSDDTVELSIQAD